MLAHLHAMDADGSWVPVRVGETGIPLGASSAGGGLPRGASSKIAPWSYAAESGGITDTSDVTLISAAGVGKSNYLTSLQVMNASSTATEVVIKSGSTVLWRASLGASMIQPVSIKFDRPLISANNTALTAACVTTSSKTYINAQGYQDVTLEALNAEATPQIEVFDQAGAQVFDAAGNPVYQ